MPHDCLRLPVSSSSLFRHHGHHRGCVHFRTPTMRYRPSLPSLCALLVSLTPAATAAAQPTPPASAPPVIRTNANLVLVDVVVTDKGKPVQSLAARQFHILENGKDQHISVF